MAASHLLLADRMQQALALEGRQQRCLAVCYLDLDGFKAVNDNFDHQVGDDILREIGTRLSDFAADGGFLAHLHGDEFVLVTEGLRTEAEIDSTIAALTQIIEVPIEHADGAIRLSASIGCQPLTDLDAMDAGLREADRRMAAAKEARAIASGRDRRRS